MTTPIDILMEIKTVPERMEAIAADIESGANYFAGINPYDLVVNALLLHPDDDIWQHTHLAQKYSFKDMDESWFEHVDDLNGRISPDRFAELKNKSEQLIQDHAEDDDSLTPEELQIIIGVRSAANYESGAGFVHCATTITTKTGTQLEFQVIIGDAGDWCGIYSPYEIRKGEGWDVDDEGFVEYE